MHLAAYISGNSYPQYYSYETWYASAVNGTAPYTYAWYRDGSFVGSGASYSDYVGDVGFQLQLSVTDAAGATVTSYLWVTPGFDPGGTGCGPQEPGLYQETHQELCLR